MSEEGRRGRRGTAFGIAAGSVLAALAMGAPFEGCAFHATFCEAHPENCAGTTAAGGAMPTTSTMVGTGSTSSTSMCPPGCDDMNPCTDDGCDASGACTHANVADNTALPDANPNDCQKPVCMGGASVLVENDAEMPSNGNDCQTGSCSAGMPTIGNKPDGTACGAAGAFMCLDGKCGCNGPADCGNDSACGTWSCDANVCKEAIAGAGPAIAQFPKSGDCQVVKCDGTTPVPTTTFDPTDPTVGGNPCVSYVCSATQPPSTVPQNKGAGTACNGSNECDGGGNCCVPNGAACSGVQCGTMLDNCNTLHTCGTCGPNEPDCVGNKCVQCVASNECTTNPNGGACLTNNHCGCNQPSDCANVPATPACPVVGASCMQCQTNLDCQNNPRGHQCNAAGAYLCGCFSNGDCLNSPYGQECGAAVGAQCGCFSQSDCLIGTCIGGTCM